MFVLVAAGTPAGGCSRGLTASPGRRSRHDDGGATLTFVPAKVGLWLFLAVITSFFALFISAYGMRMHMGDWQPLDVPGQLWFNTGLLILSSVAFEWTRRAARRDDEKGVRMGLLAAGFFALAFLAAQLAVWQQLIVGAYLSSARPWPMC
jgi:cytochrome c oxidase subunit 3